VTPELAPCFASDGFIVSLNTRKHVLITPGGGRLEDSEKGAHVTAHPLAALAGRPNNPQFVRTAANCFLEIGGDTEDRIDIQIVLGANRRKSKRQRGRRDEEIFSHFRRSYRSQQMLRKVVDIEGSFAPAGLDFFPIQPPVGEI
jgi:hypothetical protein